MRLTIVHSRLAALAVGALAAGSPAHAQTPSDPVPSGADPFARRGWHVELGAHAAIETWNYNANHEEMYGLRTGVAYGIRSGLTLIGGSSLYYVDQRGVDAWQIEATCGIRGRVFRKGRLSVFLEFDVGISEGDTFVPPRGTRFNYIAAGGGGTVVSLRRGVHLLTGLRWIHVSNNGLAGRDRNPDIEAVGPHASMLVEF
jgi:hypothetical protein